MHKSNVLYELYYVIICYAIFQIKKQYMDIKSSPPIRLDNMIPPQN